MQSLAFDYYNARWHDPALGRFIQADTIVPNASDPLSYDRYAYVRNNPLKYIDPSGHCPQPPAEYRQRQGGVICIAGFIPTRFSDTGFPLWSPIVFTGDNRSFSSNSNIDPTAESGGSRFWLWVDGLNGEILQFGFHQTCVAGGECASHRPTIGGPFLNRLATGSILTDEQMPYGWSLRTEIGFELNYSVICSGQGIIENMLCTMSADGTIAFMPNDYGLYDIQMEVDNFPNLEAYYWSTNNQPITLFRIDVFNMEDPNIASPWKAISGMNSSSVYSFTFFRSDYPIIRKPIPQ